MKASLRADGTLCVRAETDVESFALHRWGREYFERVPDQEGKVTLLIEVSEESKPRDAAEERPK